MDIHHLQIFFQLKHPFIADLPLPCLITAICIHIYIYIYLSIYPTKSLLYLYYIPMMMKYGWHIPVVFHDFPIEFNISQPAIFDYRRIIPLITIDHHQSSLIIVNHHEKTKKEKHWSSLIIINHHLKTQQKKENPPFIDDILSLNPPWSGIYHWSIDRY